jgi:Tfp pilus assembly protein PilF
VDIANLKKMTGTPRDSAMLRLMLARLLTDDGNPDEAVIHLEAAVAMNPDYTAAWKELGKIHQQAGNSDDAAKAWQRGIEIARKNGDKQAEKEMTVFLRRLQKSAGSS